MNYKLAIITIGIFLTLKVFAQSDHYHFVHFEKIFEEGIYLTFSDFARQTPVKKTSIIAMEDPEHPNFILKVLAYKQFSYFDSLGNQITVNSNDIWGIVRRNSLYVLYESLLSKVQLNGRWGYFNTYQTSHTPALSLAPGGHYAVHVPVNTSKRTSTLIIDLKNGKITEFKRKKLYEIMSIDSCLLNEYKSLSRRKQKKLKYLYLRKLNDRINYQLPGE